jgi:hypothetical protein
VTPYPQFKEKRLHPRFAVSIPVQYTDPSLNASFQTQTHDISEEGLGLITDKALNADTLLEICLRMTDNGQEIPAKGRVVWSKKLASDKYRIGLKLEGTKLKPIPLVLRILSQRS